MKKKHRWDKTVRVVLIIALAFIIVWSSFAAYLFNRGFYCSQYKMNGVYDLIPENLTKAVTENLFDYFHNQEELQYFSDEERSHLADVKVIIAVCYALYALAIILSLFCAGYLVQAASKRQHVRKNSKRLFNYAAAGREIFIALRKASLITLGAMLLIMVLGIIFGFDRLFTAFHAIFFPQGNWSFPPYYPLIVMFPQEFFSTIAMKISIRIAIVSFVAVLVSSVALAFSRDKP